MGVGPGKGSWCGTDRLAVSTTVDPRRAIVSIGDYATGPGSDEKNVDRLRLTERLSGNVERVRMFGSATDVLIAAEAGATVLDHLGNSHDLRSPSLQGGGTSAVRGGPKCRE